MSDFPHRAQFGLSKSCRTAHVSGPLGPGLPTIVDLASRRGRALDRTPLLPCAFQPPSPEA